MKILGTALGLTILYISPALTQDFNDPNYFGGKCYSTLAQTEGIYDYGLCIPNPIKINYPPNNNYDKYMIKAVDAAAEKGDYDSAIINFLRALKIKPNSLSAQRGLQASKAAKEQKKIQEHSDEGQNLAYVVWVKISGIKSSFD